MLRILFVWTCIAFFNFIAIAFFIPVDLITDHAKEEISNTKEFIGDSSYSYLNNKTYITYKKAFVDTGIQEGSFKLFIPTEDQKDNSGALRNLGAPLFKWIDEKIKMYWNLIYFGMLRFNYLLFFFPIFAPFIIAAAFDGFYTRRIKLITFQLTSATRYGYAMHSIIFLFFVPLFFFLYPFSIHPFFVPLWFILFGLSIRLLASNLHKI
ncbi:MAG: DUF4400 domain-containing protein [Methylophilus sp.]|uniref:DUF4400 domain-containing protein n=1 Tax=Methylophilus sp. TaxID=29541 RepID=UPI003F9F8A91